MFGYVPSLFSPCWPLRSVLSVACQCRVNFPQKRRSKFPQVAGWQAWLISRRRERDFWFWADGRGGVAVIPAGAA